MLQTKSKLIIRDNSGHTSGVVLGARRRGLALGDTFSMVITGRSSSRHRRGGNKRQGRPAPGRGMLVQSRQPVVRYDGSSYRFALNGCVSLNRSAGGLSLGFRRIVGTVPYELKRRRSALLNNANLPRLARGAL
jgi:ribosomal protein L14